MVRSFLAKQTRFAAPLTVYLVCRGAEVAPCGRVSSEEPREDDCGIIHIRQSGSLRTIFSDLDFTNTRCGLARRQCMLIIWRIRSCGNVSGAEMLLSWESAA